MAGPHMNHPEPNLVTALNFIGITHIQQIAIEGQVDTLVKQLQAVIAGTVPTLVLQIQAGEISAGRQMARFDGRVQSLTPKHTAGT